MATQNKNGFRRAVHALRKMSDSEFDALNPPCSECRRKDERIEELRSALSEACRLAKMFDEEYFSCNSPEILKRLREVLGPEPIKPKDRP
jgi:hypothetical protein